MTIPRPAPQVKYELLEENSKTEVRSSNIWLAVLLVILIICSSIIALYLTWQHMLTSSKEKDKMDFLMVGPSKPSEGLAWLSSHRGKMYGLAISTNSSWSTPQLTQQRQPLSESTELKLVCYYNVPTSTEPNPLPADQVPPDLCTHLVVAFATITDGLLAPSDPADVLTYAATTSLRQKNPKLKVMLSLEWFTSTGDFAWVVSSAENRTRFVEGAVKFLEEHKFDGLDIDWEFPSWPTEVQNQTNCFTELLRLVSDKFRRHEPPLLLSVAAGAPKPIIDQSYNITLMAQYIDHVNVMAYDYHMYQTYLPITGANSPLYTRQAEKGLFTTLNLNWTSTYWLLKGMPANKIIVGVPTYGHSYTLINEDNHGWDAPSSGIGSIGTAGFTSYTDACAFMSLPEAQSVFDYESKVPYAYRQKEWISFDNEQSLAYKAEYVKKERLGGVMVYSINTDDFSGSCSEKSRFPLTYRVKNVLEDDQL